jgi:hypothetical protein
MSDNRHDKLDSLLRSRRVEAASPDLAQQIILKARGLPQVRNISLWQSVRQLFAEFRLPKPGYVLASALIIGMLVGFSTAPDNSSIKEASSSTIPLYLSGDEDLL